MRRAGEMPLAQLPLWLTPVPPNPREQRQHTRHHTRVGAGVGQRRDLCHGGFVVEHKPRVVRCACQHLRVDRHRSLDIKVGVGILIGVVDRHFWPNWHDIVLCNCRI